MFIVLRKNEGKDSREERRGENRGREERQGPLASATNNPRQRSSAVGIDLTMEHNIREEKTRKR
jgi:hypothetical protein